MRASAVPGMGLFLLLAFSGADMIKLVPECDAQCRSNALATYYVVSPAAPTNPKAVNPNNQRQSVPQPAPPPVYFLQPQRPPPKPRAVTSTITRTVFETPYRPPAPQRVVMQPPAQPQPARILIPMQIAPNSQRPAYNVVAYPPQQNVTPPSRYPAKTQPVDNTGSKMIGKIVRKINMIYDILVGMNQKKPQNPTPVPLVLAPVVTRTVVQTVAPASIFPTPQAPSISKQPVSSSQTPATTKPVDSQPVPCPEDSPPASQEPPVPEKRPVKISPPAPKKETFSLGHQDHRLRRRRKPLKKPYLSRMADRRRSPRPLPFGARSSFPNCFLTGRPLDCVNTGFSPNGLDIGNALAYRNRYDDGDQVVYLSDLMN